MQRSDLFHTHNMHFHNLLTCILASRPSVVASSHHLITICNQYVCTFPSQFTRLIKTAECLTLRCPRTQLIPISYIHSCYASTWSLGRDTGVSVANFHPNALTMVMWNASGEEIIAIYSKYNSTLLTDWMPFQCTRGEEHIQLHYNSNISD